MKLFPLIMIPVAALIGITAFTRIANTRGVPAGRGYDVLRYDLDLSLSPGGDGLIGTEKITFTLTAPSPEVRFDASSRNITIDSVTRAGRNLRFSHSGNEVQVLLPGARQPADTQSLLIHYRAVAAFDGRYDSGGVYMTSKDGRMRIGTISEPNFAREWWVCNDRPSDKALVSLSCTLPPGMTAVSNGRQEPVRSEGAMQTFRWESGYPIATYLVFLGAAGYAVTADTMRTTGGGTLDLFTYAYPEDSAKAAADFINIKSILGYFSKIYGPYPFPGDKFAIAEVEGRLTMENQTVVAIEKDLITGDRENENTIVHETAHQWWGDLVTPSSWKHIWLAEAFATMSEALYIESRRGPEVYARYIDVLMDQPAGFYDSSVVGRDSGGFWESFSPSVYYKGALTLHMLRRMVGDTVFFASLRDFLNDPARKYGNASTEDFIGVCEARYGAKLDWFFNQWLMPPAGSADRPALACTWSTAGTADETGLALELRQEQEGPLVYRLPFKVTAYTGGKTETFSLIDSARTQTFRWRTGAPVDSVAVDRDRDIFMTITMEDSL